MVAMPVSIDVVRGVGYVPSATPFPSTRAFFDPASCHAHRRVVLAAPMRVGHSIYLYGSENPVGVPIFRAWIIDDRAGEVVPIGDIACADEVAAQVLWLRSMTHLWTAAVVAHVAQIANAVLAFHRAVEAGGEEAHQQQVLAQLHAEACGASLEWAGASTALRWTDAEGSPVVESPVQMAVNMRFRTIMTSAS